VWVGNIVGKQALRNISLPTGGAAYARHRIFEPIIASLTSMYGGSGFPDPPSSMRSGNTITIPAVGGQDVASVKALLESLGFMVTIGDPVPSSQTTGTVATTDPPPGTPVSKGYSIVIHPSDGSLYVVMPSDLVGKDPTTATNDLVALGFNPGNISYNWVLVANPLEYCTVTGSSPGAGAPTSKQGSVTLDVGSDVAGTPPLGCSP
jgi:beta-lactam-binding protein with PASTA domain